MATQTDRKLYLGPRLRVLRRELGLNQAQMAEELGVSPSYLNHLERNQRPLTAQMLVRLANTYEIDVRDFVSGANPAAASDLHAIFADPLVRDIGVPRHEVMEVAENHPGVAEAVARLYRALGDLRQVPDRIERLAGRTASAAKSIEWLGAHLQARRYHLAELDAAAEALSGELGADRRAGMREALAVRHGVRVEVVRDGVLLDALWHYDLHRRRLLLAERLSEPSRQFAIAMRLAELALAGEIEAELVRADPPDAEARALLRRALVNYAAAAIVMPYAAFLEAATASGYDLDLLQARFGVSYEQAAHRLVTLGRAGAKGIPHFLLRIDAAGVVSKRASAEGAWLARMGGGCARWGVHHAFRLPGETIVRTVETPEGEAFVTLARAVRSRPGAAPQAIILGFPIKYRGQVAIAAADAGPPLPIGSTCHLCERPRCPDRAVPPVTLPLDLVPGTRSATPFPFRSI